MIESDARESIRRALSSQGSVSSAGMKTLESVPQVMTAVGAYMLSKWIAKKFEDNTPFPPLSEIITFLRTKGSAGAAPLVSARQIEGVGVSI